MRLRWERLILATGARERLLPFPGWTPARRVRRGRVAGAGQGRLADRRAGAWWSPATGPLLLAAAATLRREGARVVALAEEASPRTWPRFAGACCTHPRKRAGRAASAGPARRAILARTPGVAVEGDGRVEARRAAGGAAAPARSPATRSAAGWGLMPQPNWPQSLGCALARATARGDRGRCGAATPACAGVYCVGECTGVAGAVAAQLQGETAGRIVAAGLGAAARRAGAMLRALAREQAFAAAAGAHVRAARRLGRTLARRHPRLPLRGRPLVGAARPARPAQRQARHALRHGALPGAPVP